MKRRALLAAGAALALALGALSPRAARADEASGKAHFKAGVDLYDKQDYERALAEFRAAYADLHLYVIKRNIALTLRGLDRYAQAIGALEEYLAEGGDKIDSQLREAAEATITEMSAHVGTVRVTVDAHQPLGAPPVPYALTVDDEPVAHDKAALPIRIDAGVEHTFRAHADGFADGVAPATVTPGQHDVLVALELVPVTVTGMGTLRVHPSAPTATIRVDDGPPQQAEWSGEMRAGPHRVVVDAPGYARATADIAVTPDAIIDVPVTMVVSSSLPPTTHFDETRLPLLPRLQKPRLWYGGAGLTLQGETLKIDRGLDGAGTPEFFGGASVVLKLGRMLSRQQNAHWALEGVLELGGLKATYPNGAPNEHTTADVAVFNWLLAPELVYRSGGDFQLLAGVGAGLEGEVVDGTFIEGTPAQTVDRKSSGVGAMGLAELGFEVRLKKVFVQFSVFGDVHGQSSVESAGTADFTDPAGWRGGLRLMIGTPLF